LPTEELLAKIDALDWDDTLTEAGPGAAPSVPTRGTTGSTWLVPALAVVALLVAVAVLFLLLDGDEAAKAGALPAAAVPPVTAAPAEPAPLVPAEPQAAVEAAERERVAKLEQAVRKAEEHRRRAAAERQRKAEEEELARLEQERRERELRAQEEARLRAEREAAEARARVPVAAPAPKGPASPQELCAGEGNFFSRGLCESRACGRPEWEKHPYCVKRMEDQIRRVNSGG
jgi:type IV secretory pathway VirB10-like protein